MLQWECFFWIAVRGGEWRASETTAFVPKGMGMGCIWKCKLELSWALVETDSDLSEERKDLGVLVQDSQGWNHMVVLASRLLTTSDTKR